MRHLPVALLLVCRLSAQQPPPASEIPNMTRRVAEEADVFAHQARSVLSEEKLQQRTRKAPSRFHPRIGDGAAQPPKQEFLTREIVSEYGFSSLKDSPNALHEFRTVISVDGRKVLGAEKARRTLTLGVASPDDNLKKQMLRDFEKHGLVGAATDFGQVILLFTKRRLPDYEFIIAGVGRMGADAAAILAFKQKTGSESLTTFAGRSALHSGLQGFVWVRLPDYLPLRVRLVSSRKDGQYTFVTEASIDYTMSAHGCIVPASVYQRETVAGKLMTENTYQYGPFRKFGAQSEIKFTEVPVDAPK
jgi:hypothetical protein